MGREGMAVIVLLVLEERGFECFFLFAVLEPS